MRWLRNAWYKRLRAIDLQMLWPTCCEQAPNLAHARAAFAVHAFGDKAWRVLGDEEIIKRIDALMDTARRF